ncbi:MAG: PqqD family protein [Actinomycetota bacterium]|nr:PqqD family protein [Actinomycetota bacterium]
MKINENIISREIQGETVLLNKQNGDYFSLNNVGTDIFNCIGQNMEAEAIVNSLFEKYDIEYEQLKSDVLSLISELKEKNILL